MTSLTTIPTVYKYGFLTSRAVDLLNQPQAHQIAIEDRDVLEACKDLVEKIIRGEAFLVGPNPEVSNLRPDDVETFNFLLSSDSQLLQLAKVEEDLRSYLDAILRTLEGLLRDPEGVANSERQRTVDFLTRTADALLASAKESARHYPTDESMPAAHD